MFSVCLLLFAGITTAADFLEDVKKLGSKNPELQREAHYRLLASSATTIPFIIEGLKDSNEDTRRHSVRLLEKILDARALPALKEVALEDGSWAVRQAAVIALARYQSPESLLVFEKVAIEDSSVDVRLRAINQVARIKKAAASSLLKALMKDKNVMVRLTAARELARLGEGGGRPLALAEISAEQWQVRAAAVQTLAYIANAADRKLLEQLKDNESEHLLVRFDAIAALRHIDLQKVPPPKRIEALRGAMADPQQAVRAWASAELIDRADDSARALLDAISRDSSHPGNQEAARALQALPVKR